MIRRVVGTLSVLLGLVAWGCMPAGGGDPKRAAGGKPPEISAAGWMNLPEGAKGVALADLKGKVAVVEFWATWCPPCRTSIPHLAELHEQHKDEGLVIIGLTDEPKEKVEPFAAEFKMPYIIGTGSAAGNDYGVGAIPHAVVVGRDGQVFWKGNPLDPRFDEALQEALRQKAPAAS
jgi:thiol-disulfide isomerase/thioredoxin